MPECDRETFPISGKRKVKSAANSEKRDFVCVCVCVCVCIYIYIYIKRTNVMQRGSMFICNCNIAVHVLDTFCVHLQEHLATVEAASGE